MNNEENETVQEVRSCSDKTSREKASEENHSSTKFCKHIKSSSEFNHRQQVDFTAESHALESSTHQVHIHYHYHLRPEQENVLSQVAQNHGLVVSIKSSEIFTAPKQNSESSGNVNQSPETLRVSDQKEETPKLSSVSTDNLRFYNDNSNAQRVTTENSEVVEDSSFCSKASLDPNSSNSRASVYYNHSPEYVEPRHSPQVLGRFDGNSRGMESLHSTSAILEGANSSSVATGPFDASSAALGTLNSNSGAFEPSNASYAPSGASLGSLGAIGSLNASSPAFGAFNYSSGAFESSSSNAGALLTNKSASSSGFFNSRLGDQNERFGSFGGVDLSQGSNAGLRNSFSAIAGASQNGRECCEGEELVTPTQAFLVSSIVVTVAYVFCLLNKSL